MLNPEREEGRKGKKNYVVTTVGGDNNDNNAKGENNNNPMRIKIRLFSTLLKPLDQNITKTSLS